MLISASFLNIQKNRKENILKLSRTSIDFLHIDVMDGKFVPNKTEKLDDLKRVLPLSTPFEVHLMVDDILSYIDEYTSIYPKYMTIHLENKDIKKGIELIKEKNIRVGISIKPDTSVQEIIPYLPFIDLVLVMSVEPGKGGQKFITKTVNKINELKRIREINQYRYFIEVDGGINEESAKLCESADILVSGSYITNSTQYQEQVDKLKALF